MYRQWPPGRRIRRAFGQRTAARALPADHSEGAEHRQRVIEHLVGKAVEPAQVGLDSQELDPLRTRLGTDGSEHREREVNGGDGEPAAGESDRVPAGTAAQIDETARRRGTARRGPPSALNSG